MIYLDNAATSLQKPKEVEEAVIRAFHTMGNPGLCAACCGGSHAACRKQRKGQQRRSNGSLKAYF